MKKDFLKFACCPECGGDFSIEEFEKSDLEVQEGLLRCSKCGLVFPVIGGVPRILRPEMLTELVAGYPEFSRKYSRQLNGPGGSASNPDLTRSLKVAKMYEYGWSIYSKVAEEYKREFDDVIDGHLTPADFKGKTVLDAGCGMGRFAYFSEGYGAREIVGFDLGEAVVTAYRDTFRDKQNAHFFQGDIYYLPLRKDIFDIVYSIGVIHHLPNPAKGVEALAALVRTGGKIFVWVYGDSVIKYPINTLRSVTLRLPFRAVRFLSFFPALFIYAVNAFYRLAFNFTPTRGMAEHIPFHQYSDRSFAGVWWISQDHLTVPIINYFKQGDLEGWLKTLPLKDTSITSRYPGKAGRSWRFSGVKA